MEVENFLKEYAEKLSSILLHVSENSVKSITNFV